MSVILITGASSGIGLATARIMSATGSEIVGISRSGRENTHQADLTSEAGCQEAVDIARTYGPIRALVLSAGVGSAEERGVGEQSTEVWRESMVLNLDAPFFLIRAAWEDLKQSGEGRIVLVSSTAASFGAPKITAYSAAKAGLLGLMRGTAQDGAPFGITCNAVSPGWVRTEMSEASAAAESKRTGKTTDEIWTARATGYAAGRTIDPDEVGHAIAFLASRESSGVSGEDIRVALGDAW